MDIVCPTCDKTYSEDEMVHFDEFGYLETPQIACKSCFIKEVKKGFKHFDPGNCEVCGTKLVPFLDEVSDIFDEHIVWYHCPNGKEDNSQEHDIVGEYILQPKDTDDDPSWNG